MASVNTRPAATEPASETPPMTLLLRFMHIGSDQCSFNKFETDVSTENIETRLECVIAMGRVRPILPISTIRKAYHSKCLLRPNEALFVLAYCARQEQVLEMKTLAYQEALTLINDQDDFLTFIKYCVKIKAALSGNDARRKGFGNGLRQLVNKWYGKFSNVELANMFGEHRSLHSWAHKDVFSLAHFNPKASNRPESTSAATTLTATSASAAPAATSGASAATTSAATVASAAVDALVTSATSASPAATSGASAATGSAATGASASSATPANVQSNVISSAVSTDREHVLKFNFKHGTEYLKYLDGLEEPLGQGTLRMKALQQYKTNESTMLAVAQIKANRFKLNQTPAHLLERADIWEALMPHLTYNELLDNLFKLKDRGLLNPDRRVAKRYVKALSKMGRATSESPPICPIRVFILKRMYEKNQRYLARTKEILYAKKMEKRSVVVNDALVMQLNVLLEYTLDHGRRAPANYFITLDLRSGNTPKHVLRNEHIDSREAMILLAYSIVKREKNALVYQYTDDKDVIERLQMPTTSYAAAKSFCEGKALPRTLQSFEQPLAKATNLQKKVDVFVVITESVARFSRRGEVPINEFNAYRQRFNKAAKFVVVNLCRSKPDLVTSSETEPKGFIEILGFDVNTPKLLYALGKGAFS